MLQLRTRVFAHMHLRNCISQVRTRIGALQNNKLIGLNRFVENNKPMFGSDFLPIP